MCGGRETLIVRRETTTAIVWQVVPMLLSWGMLIQEPTSASFRIRSFHSWRPFWRGFWAVAVAGRMM